MERKKYFITTGLLILTLSVLSAQNFRQQIYNAYINGNMEQWRRVLTQMERTNNSSNAFLLDKLNFQYGYIGWCVGTNRNSEAREWMAKMENLMDELDRRNVEPATILSYRAAMIGFRVGLNRLQAPFIGPRSIEFAQNAIKSDPNNPFGYLQYANILHFTPLFFGGSRDEAMRHYLLALSKMEPYKQGNWNYLSLLTAIASAHHAAGNSVAALSYLEKALEQEPNFQWVIKDLYPTFSKNLK